MLYVVFVACCGRHDLNITKGRRFLKKLQIGILLSSPSYIRFKC